MIAISVFVATSIFFVATILHKIYLCSKDEHKKKWELEVIKNNTIKMIK